MPHKKLLAALLVAIMITLCACSDSVAIDRQEYVLMMGIDYSANGEGVRITVMTPIITPQTSYPLAAAQGEGRTVAEAFDMLKATAKLMLNYDQVETIYINEEIARSDDFVEIIDMLMITRQFHPATNVTICGCDTAEYMKSVKPASGDNVPKTLRSHNMVLLSTAYIPVSTLGALSDDLRSPYKSPIITYAGLSGSDIDLPYENKQPGDYIAGTIPGGNGGEAEPFGSVIFDEEKMVDILTGYDTRLVQMLTGEFKSDLYYAYLGDEIIGMDLKRKGRPLIYVDIEEEAPLVILQLRFTGATWQRMLTDKEDAQTYVAHLLAQDISRVLESAAGKGADPCGLGQWVAGKFLTIEEFENYGWRQRLASVRFEVYVEVELQESGMDIKRIQ